MLNFIIPIYFISALLSFILGLFVFQQDKKRLTNILFFSFTFIASLWILSMFLGYYFIYRINPDFNLSKIFIRFAYSLAYLGLPFLAMFYYHFPKKTLHLPLIGRIFYYAISLTIGLLSAFTSLIHQAQVFDNGLYIADEFGILFPLYNTAVVISWLIIGYISLIKIFHLNGVEKKKMIISVIGCYVFISVVIITNTILPALHIAQIGPIQTHLLIKISPIYSLFFIIPTFYSIHRYRFFNFSNTTLNLIRNITLYGTFLVSIFLFYIGMREVFPIVYPVNIGLISSFFGLFVLRFAEKKIPVLTTESFKEFQKALIEFRSQIYFCDDSKKLNEILEKTFLIQLNIKQVKLFLTQKEAKEINFPKYENHEFTEELYKYKKDALVYGEIPFKNIPEKTKTMLMSELEKMETYLILPLFYQNTLIGFLNLSYREKEEGYSINEIQELLKIRDSLTVCLVNILVKMNLQKENLLMKAAIDDKTKELQRRIQEIKDLVVQQADFIAVAAHEFRTPLSIAIFQLEEILASKKPLKTVKEELKIVEESLGNLKELIQRLFDVQQYDLNKVSLSAEEVDMYHFIENIYDNFTLVMKDKGIQFTLDNKVPKNTKIKIDKHQIRQVMHNLLTNAYKFTSAKGIVELRAEVQKKKLRIELEDNGEGVGADQKKYLFKKFKQKNQGSGIGLGLYLSKKIIDLHHGKIRVQDGSKEGAIFIVELPC